jgi:hypothetical protein
METATRTLADEARDYRARQIAAQEEQDRKHLQRQREARLASVHRIATLMVGSSTVEDFVVTLNEDESLTFEVDGLAFRYNGQQTYLVRDCERCGEPFENQVIVGKREEFLWSLGGLLEQPTHNFREGGLDGLCPRDFDEDGNLVLLPEFDDAEMARRKKGAYIRGLPAEKPATVEEKFIAATRALIDARIPYTQDI